MQSEDSKTPDLIYRIGELTKVVGAKPPTIFEWVREGRFPRPIKLGKRASGWLGSEVAKWQRQRIAERDGEAA